MYCLCIASIARLPHFLGVFATWTLRITFLSRLSRHHQNAGGPCLVQHICLATAQPFSKVLQYIDTGLYAAHQYSFTVAAVSTQGTGNCSPQLAPKPSQNTESNFDGENGKTSWGRTNMLGPNMVNMVGHWWVDWRKNCLRWFDPDTCPWNVFKGLKTESQAKIERPTAADGIVYYLYLGMFAWIVHVSTSSTDICINSASVFLFLHRRPWTAKWSSSCHDRTCRLGARIKVEGYKLHKVK